MTAVIERDGIALFHGDCIEQLRAMPDASIDSLVTDPPAGIGFMGKAWDDLSTWPIRRDGDAARETKPGKRKSGPDLDYDYGPKGRAGFIAFLREVARECFRVMKPGAHGLVWALPRTSHWTATALEEAGFEIREKVFHIFGSGFPKSLNVSKAMAYKGSACVCGKDVSLVRREMDAADAVPGGAKQDVLEGVHESTVVGDADGRHAYTAGDVSELRVGLSAKVEGVNRESEVLFAEVQRPVSCDGSDIRRETAEDCAHRSSGMDGGVARKRVGEDERSSEPRLEGRRDDDGQARDVREDSLRQVSSGIRADGSQGRLRDGASPRDGEDGSSAASARRGGASSGSQSAQQRTGEPGAVAGQPVAQARGAWPICDRCSKPLVPSGLGTALKPATEEWILIRKPTDGTVAENVQAHGTGAINVDGCRVPSAGRDVNARESKGSALGYGSTANDPRGEWSGGSGRWPANLVLSHSPECRRVGERKIKNDAGDLHGAEPSDPTSNVYGHRMRREWRKHGDADGMETIDVFECVEGCPVAEMDRQSLAAGIHAAGHATDGVHCARKHPTGGKFGGVYGEQTPNAPAPRFGDSGGASRFFHRFEWDQDTLDTELEILRFIYSAKPSTAERDLGCEGVDARAMHASKDQTISTQSNRRCAKCNRVKFGQPHCECAEPEWVETSGSKHRNFHPTVKGQQLMRHLVRLITPPKGVVLDPFAGSGSTLLAAHTEGFRAIGIEREADYIGIARKRIEHATAQRSLFAMGE